MQPNEQQFLNDLDKHLWTAADKLRANVDAAVYKHVVLGLIFLKYVSDAFKERHAELAANFRDPKHDYYLGDEADDLIAEELETRDYYTEKMSSGCRHWHAGILSRATPRWRWAPSS